MCNGLFRRRLPGRTGDADQRLAPDFANSCRQGLQGNQRVVDNHVALKAEVDGDFDKKGLPSPLVLAFYFCLSGSKISALVIVNNKTAS